MLKDWRHRYSKICHINRYGKNKKGLLVSSFLVSLFPKNELFISRSRKESCVCSTINPREVFMLSFYRFFLHLNSVIDSAPFNSAYKLSYCQTPQLESLGGMINDFWTSGHSYRLSFFLFFFLTSPLLDATTRIPWGYDKPNSLPKLELLTNGEAVISLEFRELLGCSKADGRNTQKFWRLTQFFFSY